MFGQGSSAETLLVMVISKTDLILSPVPIPFGRVVGCSFGWIRISLATFEDLQATTVHHHARHVRLGGGFATGDLQRSISGNARNVLNGLVALFDTFMPDFFGDAFVSSNEDVSHYGSLN